LKWAAGYLGSNSVLSASALVFLQDALLVVLTAVLSMYMTLGSKFAAGYCVSLVAETVNAVIDITAVAIPKIIVFFIVCKPPVVIRQTLLILIITETGPSKVSGILPGSATVFHQKQALD
jgi:hypothetical protein